MESENKIRQTINGLRKYQELISDLIKILEPIAKKYPSGGFISYSEPKWVPTTPNQFMDKNRVPNDSQKSISELMKESEEITEKGLIKLGFHRLGYPELRYVLNEETFLVLFFAEGEWHGAIHQFQGLKPPMERVYIPKGIKTISDVQLLITGLSEDKNQT